MKTTERKKIVKVLGNDCDLDPTNGAPPGFKVVNSLHPFRDLRHLELSRVQKPPMEIFTTAMTICAL